MKKNTKFVREDFQKRKDNQGKLMERLPCNGLHRYRITGGPERKDVLTMFLGFES